MRAKFTEAAEKARCTEPPMATRPGEPYGAFSFKLGKITLQCIVDNGQSAVRPTGWEHVSVHARQTIKGKSCVLTPTWEEMDYVKRQCWDDSELVWQYHINDTSKKNIHPHVLHLWRNPHAEPGRPPQELV